MDAGWERLGVPDSVAIGIAGHGRWWAGACGASECGRGGDGASESTNWRSVGRLPAALQCLRSESTSLVGAAAQSSHLGWHAWSMVGVLTIKTIQDHQNGISSKVVKVVQVVAVIQRNKTKVHRYMPSYEPDPLHAFISPSIHLGYNRSVKDVFGLAVGLLEVETSSGVPPTLFALVALG